MTIRRRVSNRSAPVLQPGARLERASGFRFSSLLKGKPHAAAGRSDAALGAVDEAISISGETGERWAIAEVIRLKAQILARSGRGEADEVEALLNESIETARLQGAKSWRPRAACDLVQFQRERGREHDSLKLLRSIYRQFTEGFGTEDLVTAKALMETGSGARKRGGKAQKAAASGRSGKGVERSGRKNRRHAARRLDLRRST